MLKDSQMDDLAELLHDNPLFSPTLQYSQEKCWDVDAEITESSNSPKISEGHSGKNACLIEEQLNFNSNSPQSSGKARDSKSGGGRPRRQQSIMEDDKEWKSLAELGMRVRKLMEEQEEDGLELYGNEEGNIKSYSGTPMIIQAGGVASYHPIYSPFTPRPRFLRYRASPADEISIPKRRPGQSITEAEAERSNNGCSICQEGARYEGIEANVNESYDPEFAQEPHNLKEQRSEITIEDVEQPQGSAELDHTMEPNSNSLMNYRINTKTVGFRRSRSVLCKMMLPLFLFLALSTASSGFGLLNTRYGGAKNVHDHKAPMNALPLRAQFSLKKYCYSRLWELLPAIIQSEYMSGGLKNSSRAVVDKYVDSVYLCSCSALSYLKSCTGCMGKEFGTIFINLTRRFVGNLKLFCQDLLVGTRSAAQGIRGFCKCFNPKRTVGLQAVSPEVISINNTSNTEAEEVNKHDTNQRNQGNLSTEHIDHIEELVNSTMDAENHDNKELHDQMVAADQAISTFSEDSNVSESFHSSPRVMESQQVDLNHEPAVLPITQDSFNGTSQDPNAMLDLDNSSAIIWKFVAIVAPLLIILLILIASGSLYFWWGKAQEMKMINYMKSKKIKSGRQTFEYSALGSFVEYVDLPSSSEGCGSGSKEISSTPNRTAVRRSMRIRNKSLSPLPSMPSFTSPN